MKPKLLLLMLFLLSSISSAQISHGTVLAFDGDDWVDIGERVSLNFGTFDFTISAWFKTTSQNKQQIIIRKGLDNRTSGEARWVMRISQTNVLSITVDHVDNSAGSTFTSQGQTIVTDGQWHHVSAVFDRDETLRVYLDGNLEIDDPGLVNQSGSLHTVFATDVIIGRDNSGSANNFFAGFLDEIRIWDHIRTQTQIQTTMHDTLGRQYYAFPDSGMLAYWRFDEGDSSEVIYDLTQNDNNGLLIGPQFVEPATMIEFPFSKRMLDFELYQSYPNPFNPETHIEYRIEHKSHVNLSVFNILGQRITTLVSAQQTPGSYSVIWNGSDESGRKVSSGGYYYLIEVNDRVEAKSMIFVK